MPHTSSAHVSYEMYRGNYEHFHLRLQATLACAMEQNDSALTQELLALEGINRDVGKHHLYESTHQDRVHPESRLPFRVSPEPFVLPENVRNSITVYGRAITEYYKACASLLAELPADHRWRKYLDHHKPDSMVQSLRESIPSHIFLRPDFVLTDGDPVVTEIETSPFGLALSHFLNVSYTRVGKNTMVNPDAFPDTFLRETLGTEAKGRHLCFALTDYTKKYAGQFAFLADNFRASGVDASVAMVDDLELHDDEISSNGRRVDALYRGFYLHEATRDHKVAALLQQAGKRIFPSCKPQLEEKALMAMLWEPELQSNLQQRLGANFTVLQKIIPPTWVLDPQHPPSFPFEISSWSDVAKLSRKQRMFVLKTSGFSAQSSWAKGVTFLEKLSQDKCRETINASLADTDNLYVLQQFRKGTDFTHKYFDFHARAMKEMRGRVRFTPYYAVRDGKLLTAKATLCENTDYIHAMVDSINAPVI